MKAFLDWVRERFSMADMMHLADVDDETLQILMFQNGTSRDELIKLLVYKLLLDIDSEDEGVQKHSNYFKLLFITQKIYCNTTIKCLLIFLDIEKILVTFGLLKKEVAKQFLSVSICLNTFNS